MDIFAHALWTGAAFKTVNKKRKKKLSVWWGIFWGVAPDLFAFTIPFVWTIWNLSLGRITLQEIPQPRHNEPPSMNHYWVNDLARLLYNIGHSGIVFVIFFGVVWYLYRRPRFELFGWLLHLVIDVPTHTYAFYPSPFFWPIFGWDFRWGIAWEHPAFMLVNYSLLSIVWFAITRRRKRKRLENQVQLAESTAV
ncbi:MAG: hypothetical protein AAB482_02225 [Patescibacteria group bacterium]